MQEFPLLGDGASSARPSTVQPPSRRETVLSAFFTVAVSAAVGLAATIILGLVLVFFDIANTDPTADANTQTGLPPIVFEISLVGVLVVVWLAACRVGFGTPGDAIMELVPRTADGAPAGRGRNRLRAAAYVVVFGTFAELGRAGLGALAVLALWGVALVRHDRRSLIDLVVGVFPHSSAPRRDAAPHPWAR